MFAIKLALAGIGPMIAHWSIGAIIIAGCIVAELFLGAIVAIKEHGHLGTDMLIARLGFTGKKICAVIEIGRASCRERVFKDV